MVVNAPLKAGDTSTNSNYDAYPIKFTEHVWTTVGTNKPKSLKYLFDI
jgi:hypothetical protein